ncbi:MAG: PadR family transcriptional regulator [Myxococcota bacterium]
MSRRADAPSHMEILVLSSLARVPMHGYEIKLELRYRHVRWWAKFEHGHLYATLDRLEKRGFIRAVQKKEPPAPGRERRTFRVTPAGKKRVLEMLRTVGSGPDATFFDVDLFLAGSYLLPQAEVVEILHQRRDRLKAQIEEAEALERSMGELIPLPARLIIRHRLEHLVREAAFAQATADAISVATSWGPFLGEERITDFLRRTGVDIEAE